MVGKKEPDMLPRREPHIPTNPRDAVLVFGVAKKKKVLNYYEPTDAPPGTAEKITVLRDRAANRLPLWHPEDRADFENLTRLYTIIPDSGEGSK